MVIAMVRTYIYVWNDSYIDLYLKQNYINVYIHTHVHGHIDVIK